MQKKYFCLFFVFVLASKVNGQVDFHETKPIGNGNEWTQDLAFGDLDGDGDLDLVTAEWNVPREETLQTGEVPAMIYWNDGKGNFSWKSNLPPTVGFNSVKIADMDGDNFLDIVTLMNNSDIPDQTGLCVLFNDGKGNLSEKFLFPYSCPRLIEIGDFNKDGLPDILVGRNGFDWFSDPTNTNSTNNFILFNMGNRQWRQTKYLENSSIWTQNMAIGDLDNDGDLDVIFGCDSFNEEDITDGSSQSVLHNDIFLNDGKGTFSLSRSFGDPQFETWALAIGDIDQDGDLDIIEGNVGFGGDPQPNYIYRNGGKGNFDKGTLLSNVQNQTCSLAIGDVDRDGDLDIVEGNTGLDYIYLNDGKGTFNIQTQIGNISDFSNVVRLADVNNDNMLDIATGNGDADEPFTPEQSLIYINATKTTYVEWKIIDN